MSAFDNSEYETARQQYEDEAKQRWGGTDAYKESQAKTAGYSKEKWNDVLAGMNGVFAEFAECKKCGESADSDTAQQLVKKLQDAAAPGLYVAAGRVQQILFYPFVPQGVKNVDYSILL